MKRLCVLFTLPLAFVLTTVQAQRNASDLQAQAKAARAQINDTLKVRGLSKPINVLRDQWVLVRDPLGEFEPQAFLSTEIDNTPEQMLTMFVRRWRREVTFEEARVHLCVETQRQWSDLAIAHATPVLFGLFSLVTL